MQNPDFAPLYTALEARCNGKAGFLLTKDLFLRTFGIGIDRMERAPAADRERDTRLPGVSFTTTVGREAAGIRADVFDLGHREVHLLLGGISMQVDLHRQGNPAALLSTIQFGVTNVEARLEVASGTIVARRLSYTITPTFAPSPPTRDATMTALGWNQAQKDTFAQFEQFVAFASPSFIADQLLGMVGNLPLSQWLAGLSLGDPLAVEFFDHPKTGASLLIRGLTASVIQRSDPCPCPGINAGEVSANPSGSLLNGDLAVNIATGPRANPPAPAPGLPAGTNFLEPYAFLLLPKDALSVAFGPSVYPAISLGDRGGWGSAQYSWSATVSFRSLALDLDALDGSLLLTADLGLHMDARAWVNLPCDGELELASGSLDGEVNNVRIRLRPVFDIQSKRVLLDSALENHDVTNINAHLNSPLGWPLDEILRRVLEHNAPGMITQQLRSAVGSGRFTLLELEQLLTNDAAPIQPVNALVTYVGATGVLTGIGSRPV
jgi:hypothetical protein